MSGFQRELSQQGTQIKEINSHQKMTDTQIAQLAEKVAQLSNDKLPGQPSTNPASHSVNAIHLRSGNAYGEPMVEHLNNQEAPISEGDKEVEGEVIVESSSVKGDDDSQAKSGDKGKRGDRVRKARMEDITSTTTPEFAKYAPKPPYPERLVERRLNAKYHKFMECMKGLNLNVPFLEAIKEMPTYAKFLKELLSNKRKQVDETVTLPSQVSAILQRKMPPKLKDPGSYTLPVAIGDLGTKGALADLGASVSLMPLSIAKLLDYEMVPSRKLIQMADRSTKVPCGELEDVPIRVGNLIAPCDFVIMDIEEDPTTPLILGREALRTLGAVVDCKDNTITCEVADERVVFEFSKLMKQPMVEKLCRIDLVNEELDECERIHRRRGDPLDEVMHYEDGVEKSKEAMELEASLDQACPVECEPSDELPLIQTEDKEERTTPPPKVDLKPLPPSLKYAFIDSACCYPFIVNASLDDPSLEKLKQLLRKYQGVIGYSIDDLKGISPSLCMHRIHLDDGHTSSIEPQRRLNPTMKEVVKKEILKLREAGIIYAISDSKWVSPVHVVPKKGGMTIVKDDKGNDISTRTVTGWRMCIDYRRLNKATKKDHYPLPFMDQMLERLVGHSYFCFLDGYSGFFQIPIHPEDQEKTTFTCPFGTFAYRRMPFGLCNAPSTFQRCMSAIFSDMLEDVIEVFMDDFSVCGSSLDNCLANLE